MPRRSRVVLPGVPHHVSQRGNNRQSVFWSSEDRYPYLEMLVRHATRTGEPLGSKEFVVALERQAGRRLRVLGRGHPRKVTATEKDRPTQAGLFATAAG